MILIYFNVHDETTYYYLSKFDSSKVLGESNKFGDILVGLFLVDEINHKLVPHNSGYMAELLYINGYYLEKEKKGGK